MSSKKKPASRAQPPPLRAWARHELLRYGAQAAAVAALLGLIAMVVPTARDTMNSDPPPWIGRQSFDPLAGAIGKIQIDQQAFISRLNDYDVMQLQRECLSLLDRKEGLEIRRAMSGNDRLVRDTLDQVNRGIARIRKQIESAGQIPDCP